jgi:hypothetical protein
MISPRNKQMVPYDVCHHIKILAIKNQWIDNHVKNIYISVKIYIYITILKKESIFSCTYQLHTDKVVSQCDVCIF